MRSWDSSALVSLLLQEPGTPAARRLAEVDPAILVWALTPVEILSAVWRHRRQGDLDDQDVAAAEARLGHLERDWTAVSDLGPVERRARRVIALHPLRAADAVQLAAALVACDERTDRFPFVSLDDRLREAARREGFAVLP